MKKIIFFITFILPQFVIAQNVNKSTCRKQGEQYGKMNTIDNGCYNLAVKNSSKYQRATSLTADVVGIENILFINYKKKESLRHFKVAGDRSGITDIKAVTLGDTSKNVYVLNNKSLLVYDILTDGNSAPRRVIDIGKSNCSSLKVSESKNKFYVHCSDGLVFGSLAGDSRLISLTKKPKDINNMSLYTLGISSNVDLEIYNDDLVILDKNFSLVHSVDMTEKSQINWSINLKEEGMGRTPASLKVSKGELKIIDINGGIISFGN